MTSITSITGPYFELVSNLANIACENGAVNLSNDHTDVPCMPELLNALIKHITEGRNKYAPSEGVKELREVIAARYNSDFNFSYNPETEITITSGAIQALHTAISSTIREGDEVIVFEPAFETYVPSILASGGRPVFYQLNEKDFTVDWCSFAKLITSKTKLIILNLPHNPTGIVFSDESIEQFQRLLNGTKITILSDESFAHLLYDQRPPFSIASYPKLAERSIIVGSLGKTLFVPGWKIGYCLAPEQMMQKFREVHRYQVYSVNLPMQLAIADYMNGIGNWNIFSDEFQKKRDLFAASMKESRFTLFPVQGGFFQILGYEQISQERDTDFCFRLAYEYGVTAFPLSPFYHDNIDNQRLRVCFGKDDSLLRIAAERLSKL